MYILFLRSENLNHLQDIDKNFLQFMQEYQDLLNQDKKFYDAIYNRFSIKKTLFFVKTLDKFVDESMRVTPRLNELEVPTLPGNVGEKITACYCMIHLIVREVSNFNYAMRDIFNNFEILRPELKRKFSEEELNEIEQVINDMLNEEIQNEPPNPAARSGPEIKK